MRSTSERRIEIKNYIARKKKVTMNDLMDEFEISRSTAKRDVLYLQCYYGIETVAGKDGGIRVMEGYDLEPHTLSKKQEEVLKTLRSVVNEEMNEVLTSILREFSKNYKEVNDDK